ncbi:hypothetical protein HMPREF0208_04242 [Citrobacter koseri]|nr:hypothetical protein HMPREF0208_04242 [Citrobacter koseri]
MRCCCSGVFCRPGKQSVTGRLCRMAAQASYPAYKIGSLHMRGD